MMQPEGGDAGCEGPDTRQHAETQMHLLSCRDRQCCSHLQSTRGCAVWSAQSQNSLPACLPADLTGKAASQSLPVASGHETGCAHTGQPYTCRPTLRCIKHVSARLVLQLAALSRLLLHVATQLAAEVAGRVRAPEDLRGVCAQTPQHVRHVPAEALQQPAVRQLLSLPGQLM